jgi:nucleoporin NUP42
MSNATAAPFSGFANTANAFSQGTTPATTNVFGAPSQPTTSAPFGATPQPAPTNIFGQPSGQAPNAFGGASAAPFGVPPLATNNPFAPAPSAPPAQPQIPFGATPSAPNPFTTPQPSHTVPNPFGIPLANNPNSNPLSAAPPGPTQPGINGNTGTTGHPPLNSYSSRNQSGQLTMFKGKRVVYQKDEPGIRNMEGSWSKIWFPEGAPPFYKDTEMDESAYDDNTKAAYMQMRNTGSFPGGVMPMLPPMREWCTWDF